MKTSVKARKKTLLSVAFEGQPDQMPELRAYVFDAAGKLKEETVVKKSQVELQTPVAELRSSRVFIAPQSPDVRNEKPALDLMIRRFAYEPAMRFSGAGFDILPIPEFNWKFWLWKPCRVKGRVMKPVLVNGTYVDRPVCGARVHICEVDKIALILPTLPEDVIFKLRDCILQEPELIPEPFDPRIPPQIDPPRFDPIDPIDPAIASAAAINAGGYRALAATGGVSTSLSNQFSTINVAAELQSESQRFSPSMPAPVQPIKQPIPDSVIRSLNVHSADAVRSALAANFTLLYPYICMWRWTWPWLYRCDELAVVQTDELGRFDTTIWYQCFTDQPDLYFWVEYMVGEQWETVYNPPVACYTYWDFDCEQEVTIRLHDSRVDACGDVPELEGVRVEVRKIGASGFVSRIEQSENISPAIQGINFNRQGTITGIGDASGFPQPFGGTLIPQVVFGSQLIDAGITHFRWSYRRKEDAAGNPVTDNWKVLDTAVSRRYREETPEANIIRSYPLGPDPALSNTAFKIPRNFAHELELTDVPALGSVPNPDDRYRSWVAEEFGSAVFNSLLTGNDASSRLSDAGLYELKFELMRISGNTAEVVSLNKEDWLMPDPSNPTYSPEIPDPQKPTYLDEDSSDSTRADAFHFAFRIDNNHCVAIIDDVKVDGIAAGSDCGFATYADLMSSEAEFAFEASHPNGFARMNFNVVRGNGNTRAQAVTSGMVISGNNGYTLESDGKFHKFVSVDHLLSKAPAPGHCPQGAFAEHLYVRALATNGSVRLSGLDAGDLAAFAVEPEVEE